MPPIPELREQLVQAKGFDTAIRTALIGVEHDIRKTVPAAPAYGLCRIALEHGAATIRLFDDENQISACALVRLQYEAVVRASWLLYGAPLKWLTGASDVLRGIKEEEPIFPSLAAMLAALQVSKTTPDFLHASLAAFKTKAWTNLNSLVHGGFMSITRALIGHEPDIQIWILKSGSTLSYTAGLLCAAIVKSDERTNIIFCARQNWPACFHALPNPSGGDP